MDRRIIDLTGKKFGAWTVLGLGEVQGKHRYWNCVCDCGVERAVRGQPLRNGSTISCGCQASALMANAKSTHGLTKRAHSPEYRAWQAMHIRCREENKHARRDYFDRGIRVCKSWNEYENFILDMGRTPHSGWTLDRRNNDLGYSPENCRWADKKEQADNRRNAVNRGDA